MRGLDFTAARRQHLAVRASGVTLLLFNSAAAIGTAYSRWRVSGRPGADARWRLELVRCRGRAADDTGLLLRGGVAWTDGWFAFGCHGCRPTGCVGPIPGGVRRR
ncbi:hypothetical protein [Magnetospirillum gryphiswaldense]|uniref:hypothetical protein n=1 Tax=Magnetospirillum gryphiswaldense TaxID=55518 RepID=UPI00130EEFE7|nr:hypothetical protein [Magnetospirillum gryphiswaldense]